jgi:hypothetical protein
VLLFEVWSGGHSQPKRNRYAPGRREKRPAPNQLSIRWRITSIVSANWRDRERVAIGSDLDGGYGSEQSPIEIETIADVQQLVANLKPCPESPAAKTTFGNAGCLSTMKCSSGDIVYRHPAWSVSRCDTLGNHLESTSITRYCSFLSTERSIASGSFTERPPVCSANLTPRLSILGKP